MSLYLADKFPIFMLVITASAILFVIQYMRNAERMAFKKQVHLLKLAVLAALLLLMGGYGVRLIVTLLFSADYFKISFAAGCAILFDPLVRIVYAIIILKTFKICLKILNNFSSLKIFEQQNIEAMAELDLCIMKLLAIRIIFNIIYCIFIILIDISSNHAFGSLDASFDSLVGILSLFILMLIINTITTIYTKAVEQYQENSLII